MKTIKKILIIIFVLTIVIFNLPMPAKASASFSISGSRTITAGRNITVTITANRNVAYNAISLNVSFSNFTYVGVSATGGWTPIVGPSVSGNTVSFSGALLGQSVTGARNVLSLTLRAPNSGSASISVTGQLSGEGEGTGTENGSGSATFQTVPAPTPPPPTPTPRQAPGNVSITSSTHPDQNKWYSNPSLTLNWDRPGEAIDFSYILDTIDSTEPTNNANITDQTLTFNDLEDGIYYFHIKARNDIGWGPVSRYKISIDTNQPQPFTTTLVKDATEESYFLFYATNDTGSGISNYDVFIDGELIANSQSGMQIPIQTEVIRILAKDNAGNIREVNTVLAEKELNDENKSPIILFESNDSNLNMIFYIIIGILSIYALVITLLFADSKGLFARFKSHFDGGR